MAESSCFGIWRRERKCCHRGVGVCLFRPRICQKTDFSSEADFAKWNDHFQSEEIRGFQLALPAKSETTRGAANTIEPGSVKIRPTRLEAEDSSVSFYKLLASLRGSRDVDLQALADATDDATLNPLQNQSKKANKQKYSEVDRSKIIKRIFEDENFLKSATRAKLRSHQDALYFAFLNFMNTKETSQDNARASAVGTYKLWRFSVEHEGEFVLGRVDIMEDEETRAVKVRMIQPKKPKDGVRGSMETFEGYFFRMADVYAIIQHDRRNEDLRISLFPRFKFDDVGVGDKETPGNPRSVYAGRHRHLIHLDGFGLGIDGNSGYFSPAHLSLVMTSTSWLS